MRAALLGALLALVLATPGALAATPYGCHGPAPHCVAESRVGDHCPEANTWGQGSTTASTRREEAGLRVQGEWSCYWSDDHRTEKHASSRVHATVFAPGALLLLEWSASRTETEEETVSECTQGAQIAGPVHEGASAPCVAGPPPEADWGALLP